MRLSPRGDAHPVRVRPPDLPHLRGGGDRRRGDPDVTEISARQRSVSPLSWTPADDDTETPPAVAPGGVDLAPTAAAQPPLRSVTGGELRMLRLGCMSRQSCIELDAGRKLPLALARAAGVAVPADKGEDAPPNVPRRTRGKIRMLSRDCMSQRSLNLGAAKGVGVSFRSIDETAAAPAKPAEDILTEGQYYLGISMLVYMYSHLRETCRMGHTHMKMEDIDVHSHQMQYRGGTPNGDGTTARYLDDVHNKSAGSIIRILINELQEGDNEDDKAERDIVGDENKQYEESITAQFRSWVEDSKVQQLDDETERMIAKMKRKVARHRWHRAITAVRLSIRLSNAFCGGRRPEWKAPIAAPGCENQNRFVDADEALADVVRGRPKFFRDGSVMHNLIESGIELVWFSDMSQNDVVYGICIERLEKKVTVVFRGTVNAHNWNMNLKFDTNEYHNPVKTEYPGREDELSLHSGFALYLLRKRKDTGMSKLEEIFDKIDEIGREMAPDGHYKLKITGHSLGGALAQLCGFYAAARSRFAHLSTIYVWTFGAPRVGTCAFMHAWQHLERTGRIRQARFSVTRDLVPLVPFCNFERDDLQFYKHVGMRVQLHGVGKSGKRRLQKNLDVTYPLKHDWSSEIKRGFTNNICANSTTLAGFKHNHKLTEYQKRLHFAMTYRKALGSGVLYSDRRRNRIKSLDEYYHIRANITSDSITEEVLEQSKTKVVKRNSYLIFFLVSVLFMIWVALIVSITCDISDSLEISTQVILSPLKAVTYTASKTIHLPLTAFAALHNRLPSLSRKSTMCSCPPNHSRGVAFIGRKHNTVPR